MKNKLKKNILLAIGIVLIIVITIVFFKGIKNGKIAGGKALKEAEDVVADYVTNSHIRYNDMMYIGTWPKEYIYELPEEYSLIGEIKNTKLEGSLTDNLTSDFLEEGTVLYGIESDNSMIYARVGVIYVPYAQIGEITDIK